MGWQGGEQWPQAWRSRGRLPSRPARQPHLSPACPTLHGLATRYPHRAAVATISMGFGTVSFLK